MSKAARTRRALTSARTGLKLSLLAALGVLPPACGGATLESSEQSRCKNNPVTQLMLCDQGYSHRPVPTQCTPVNAPVGDAAGAAPAPGLPRADGQSTQCNARNT